MLRTAPFSLLLLVSLATLGGCATMGADKNAPDEAADEVPLEQLLADANESLRNGDLDAAQVGFALAVEREPDNTDALYKLAVIHREKSNLPVAEGLLRTALSISPQHQGSREALGIVLLEQERLGEAEERLLEALEGRPDSWQVMNALGVINDMHARHTEAQELFTAALFVTPRSAKISNNLGYSFYLAGDYDRAEKHIRDATRFDAKYGRAWSNLALVYARLGRYRDATAAFDKIVERHQSANNLGYLGLLENNETLARVQLERAVRLSPSYYTVANENLFALDGRPPQLTSDAVATDNRQKGSMSDQKSAHEALLGKSTMQSTIVPVLTAIPAMSEANLMSEESSANTLALAKAAAAARGPVKIKSTSVSLPLRPTLAFVGHAPADDSKQALRSAVKRFQKTYGLKADGHAGKRTRAKLNRLAIKKVQAKLHALGHEVGKIDGRLGRKTRAAIRAFEKEESLHLTGRPNEAVLERIDVAVSRASQQLNSVERIDYSSRG